MKGNQALMERYFLQDNGLKCIKD